MVSWDIILREKKKKKTATEFPVTEKDYIEDTVVASHDVKEGWSTVRDKYVSIRTSLRDKKRKRKQEQGPASIAVKL